MKILNKYFLVLFAAVLLVGCGDQDDYLTTIVGQENSERGALVRFSDFSGFSTVVSSVAPFDETRSIYDPTGNVQSVSYDLIRTIGGVTDTVTNVFESSSFPFDLQISNATLAAFAGLTTDQLLAGDAYRFEANVTRNDGAVFSPANMNEVLLNDGRGGYVHAMAFTISLACPYVPADAVGNYLIVNDPFVTSLDYASPIVAELNAAGDGVIFRDLFKHPEAFDVEFIFSDPELGLVTIAKQPAWHCDNFGCPFGEGRVDGSGSFFTCIGLVNVTLDHTVDLGSFGKYNLQLQKQ